MLISFQGISKTFLGIPTFKLITHSFLASVDASVLILSIDTEAAPEAANVILIIVFIPFFNFVANCN